MSFVCYEIKCMHSCVRQQHYACVLWKVNNWNSSCVLNCTESILCILVFLVPPSLLLLCSLSPERGCNERAWMHGDLEKNNNQNRSQVNKIRKRDWNELNRAHWKEVKLYAQENEKKKWRRWSTREKGNALTYSDRK